MDEEKEIVEKMKCIQEDRLKTIESAAKDNKVLIKGIDKSLSEIKDNYIRLEEQIKIQYRMTDTLIQNVNDRNKAIEVINYKTDEINRQIGFLGNGFVGEFKEILTWIRNHGKKESNNRVLKRLDPIFDFIEKHYKLFFVLIGLLLILLYIISITDILEYIKP